MFRVMLADIYADKAMGERSIAGSRINWTILAPVLLTNRPGTGRFGLAEHRAIHGIGRISRADVADRILRCSEDAATFRKRWS